MNQPTILHTLDSITDYYLNQNLSLRKYTKEIAQHLVAQLNLEDFVIYFRQNSKTVLTQYLKTNRRLDFIFPESSYSVELGQGIVGYSAKRRQGIIVNDTSTDPNYISEDTFRYSEMAVPIIQNNKIIGVLDSEHSNKGFYTIELLHEFGVAAKMISFFLNESRSKSKEDTEKRHFQVFMDLLDDEEIFLNESLSANEVAKSINISPSYFSHIINKISGQSFNTIVNSYRVDHIIRLLNQNEHKEKTLLSIALSAGFNSKSSFNLNFKKKTSKSPSEYIAELS